MHTNKNVHTLLSIHIYALTLTSRSRAGPHIFHYIYPSIYGICIHIFPLRCTCTHTHTDRHTHKPKHKHDHSTPYINSLAPKNKLI